MFAGEEEKTSREYKHQCPLWQRLTAHHSHVSQSRRQKLQGDRDAGWGERSSHDAFLALDSFNEEDMTASVEGPTGDHTMTGATDPNASSKQLLLREQSTRGGRINPNTDTNVLVSILEQY